MAEVRIMRFSHKCSAKILTFCVVSLTAKFEGVPLIGGSNYGGVVSDFAMLYFGNGARYSLGDNY